MVLREVTHLALLEMVLSRQKAPEPQTQTPPHGVAPRGVRQAMFPPPGFLGTGANDFQDSLPGCIISDVRGQSAPISSPLLPRWLGDTGRRRGQQLGWLSWSPALLFLLSWPRSNCFHAHCFCSPPSRKRTVSLPHAKSHLWALPGSWGPEAEDCLVLLSVRLGSCVPKLCPFKDT